MARLQSISEQFRIARQETAEATHQVLVAVAKREHARVMATDPRPATFRRYVDGREGVAEEEVSAFGVILYEYPRLDVVVAYALAALRERSPVGPPEMGHYRDGHQLFIAGSPAAGMSAWRPGEEVMITNLRPYARKIELGSMTMTVPGTDHVYEQARQATRAIYGGVATVLFQFRDVAGGRFPALVIREK